MSAADDRRFRIVSTLYESAKLLNRVLVDLGQVSGGDAQAVRQARDALKALVVKHAPPGWRSRTLVP